MINGIGKGVKMILALEKVRLKFSPTINVINKRLKVIDKYAVYLTNDPHDLPQIFNLRYKVFFKEFSQASIIRNFYPIDRDSHDKNCIHIVVKNLENTKIVGTYRAFVGKKWDQHYSEVQFKLDSFLLSDSIKCEVGRACVDPAHRNGTVLKLLLQGIIKFSDLNNCEFIFGQSSWIRKNCDSLERMYEYLIEHSALIDQFSIIPRDAFHPQNYKNLFNSKNEGVIPPLIKMYVLAGAKFIRVPAYDKSMDCFDFFTLLNLKKSNRFLDTLRKNL